MEQYQIVPWDDMLTDESSGINLEQYVPPELEKLAHEVSKSYDMVVKEMTLITSKPDKGGAIWRIETNHGPRSLKVLHRTPQRSLFSVGAQEYVVKNGARVPGIILTREGKNSVVAGGKLWIVTDWIDTLTPVAKIDLEGAMTLCHGLGEFHQWSKGYVPPPEAGKSSRIFKWESQYQKIMAKIGWFRHIANAYPETAASKQLLSVLDMFEGQANEIFERFQASAYRKMVNKGESYWGLAHQDYGWSNGQMGPGGIWVIDLDGVAFDLPIRDLRKIITSTMDDMGAWDLAWIRGVIDAYHRANPLDQETFELLWIDMAFPNEFYKHTKEVVFTPVEFMNSELGAILDRVMMTEANKWDVLRELEKDKSKYAAGDYSEEEVAPNLPYAYRDYAKGGTVAPGSPHAAPRPGTADKRIVRLVVNPDGKAVIIPGDGTAERRKSKSEKAKALQPEMVWNEEANTPSKGLNRKLKRKERKVQLPAPDSTFNRPLPAKRIAAPGKKISKKAANKPAATKPAVSKPSASKPAARIPSTSRPSASRPAASRPTASRPSASKPAANRRVVSHPVISRPGANKPVASIPASGRSAARRSAPGQVISRPGANKPISGGQAASRRAARRAAASQPTIIKPGARNAVARPRPNESRKKLRSMSSHKPLIGTNKLAKKLSQSTSAKRSNNKAYISAYRTSAAARGMAI